MDEVPLLAETVSILLLSCPAARRPAMAAMEGTAHRSWMATQSQLVGCVTQPTQGCCIQLSSFCVAACDDAAMDGLCCKFAGINAKSCN